MSYPKTSRATGPQVFNPRAVRARTLADAFNPVTSPGRPGGYEQAFAALTDEAFPVSIEMRLMDDDEREKRSAFPIIYGPKETNNAFEETCCSKFGSFRSAPCGTCKARNCLGHWGLLTFPDVMVESKILGSTEKVPLRVINPATEGIVKQILKVICLSCNRVLLSEDPVFVKAILRLPAQKRLERLLRQCGGKTCICVRQRENKGENLVCPMQYTFKSIEPTRVIIEEKPSHYKKEKGEEKEKGPGTVSWPIHDVYNVFSFIGGNLDDNDDKKMLGYTASQLRALFPCSKLIIPTRYRPKTDKSKSHPLTLFDNTILTACAQYLHDINTVVDAQKRRDSLITVQTAIYTQMKQYFMEFEGMSSKKKGIFRSKIGSKRPGASGRSTILPNASVNFGEMLIPEELVKRALFRLETVTEENIGHLQQLLMAGKIHAVNPARSQNPDKPIDVGMDNYSNKARLVLSVGDTAYIELSDGEDISKGVKDLAVTGRQPTQNQPSVMSVFVRIVRKKNFFAISPHFDYMSKKVFAGDFDGDQLWLAAMQSPEAMEDLMHMHITRWMRSHQGSDSAIGLAYNAVIAAMILSLMEDYLVMPRYAFDPQALDDAEVFRRYGSEEELQGRGIEVGTVEYRRYLANLRAEHLEITREEDRDVRLVELLQYDPANLPPNPHGYEFAPSIGKSLWQRCVSSYSSHPRMRSLERRLRYHNVAKYSGRGLLSTLFPEDFNYRREDKENPILIRDGILLQGLMTGTVLGSGAGSLLDHMTIYYEDTEQAAEPQLRRPGGRKNLEASNFVNDATRMLSIFIEAYGFTVNYHDLLLGENTERLQDEIAQKFEEINMQIMALPMPRGSNPYEHLQYEKKYRAVVDQSQGLMTDMEKKIEKEYEVAKTNYQKAGLIYQDLMEERERAVELDTWTDEQELTFQGHMDEYLRQKEEFLALPLPMPMSTGSFNINEPEYQERLRSGQVNSQDKNARFIRNNYQLLVKSGAKGNAGNISNMTTLLGLQKLMGGRLPHTVTDGRRQTVFHRPDSMMPEANGVIRGSYVSGLNPSEMVSMASTDREGMVSTSTISPTIGHSQNLSHRALAGVVSLDGGVVMTAAVRVVLQYTYGCDGMDNMFVRAQEVRYGTAYIPHDLRGQSMRVESQAVFG